MLIKKYIYSVNEPLKVAGMLADNVHGFGFSAKIFVLVKTTCKKKKKKCDQK